MLKKVDTNKAAELLTTGEVVAIPTETVYGLAAVFDNAAAVKQIFELKNRPLDHPLIMHIADLNNIDQYGVDIPNYVEKLISRFTPGPLTFVVRKRDHIPAYITGNQDTVALRAPAHVKTQSLLKLLKKPVVAPSANPYCQISPTSANHVYRYFKDKIAILDGGESDIGIESTIIQATDSTKITILRPGIIPTEAIAEVAGVQCLTHINSHIKFPGNKKTHYAPQTPLLMTTTDNEIEKFALTQDKKYCFLLFKDHQIFQHNKIILGNNSKDYAKNIYRVLHEIDNTYDAIIVESPPSDSNWHGILDRLSKASAK